MPVKPIVVNTTPMIALWLLNRFDLWRDLYGEVLIPPAVQAEFLATEFASRQARLNQAPWIKVSSLIQPNHAQTFVGLDLGEAEVLALATECQAALVIIDELKARRYAQKLGLPLIGTVGVLLLAKENGLIPQISPQLATLQAHGLRFSQSLITQALTLANEI